MPMCSALIHDQNTFNICIVDCGYIEAFPLNMHFQIPVEIVAYCLFSTSVTLVNGEALYQKLWVNEIFTSVEPSLDHLVCEATCQMIDLYDVERKNIAKVMLRMYHNLVPKLKAWSPAISKIKIADLKLKSIEKPFVTVTHRGGYFYGQLLNRPTSELLDIFSEQRNFYEAEPKAAHLHDGSCIGHIAVVEWCGNCVETQFVVFCDVITMLRRNIFAPVISGRFNQPAFGTTCVRSRDVTSVTKKEYWDAALHEKRVEVRILNKNPDGTFMVVFTINPYNHNCLEELYLLKNPVALQKKTISAQLELKRSTIRPPSTASVVVTAEYRCLYKPREDMNGIKPPPRQIILPNLRLQGFIQRLVSSPVIQEIVRSPRGPPSAASGSKRGCVRYVLTASKARETVQLVDRAGSSIPTIPPIITYAFLDTIRPSVAVASSYSSERFSLTLIDVSTYEAELEPLNVYYASLSTNELIAVSPKVGLPFIVQSEEDFLFYRSQIVVILCDKTAQVLFVDCGNEQSTPLTRIKRFVPKFMKLSQLVWPCKLAVIDGSQLGSDIFLSTDDKQISTFICVNQGVHLVEVIHGDMAFTKVSLPVLRPAVFQLRYLVKEVANSADRELNDPVEILFLLYTDKAHSPDPEEKEEQAFGLESVNNLKPQLAEGESIIDITEPVNMDEIVKESPCDREEEVAELVDKHPSLVQSFEAGTSDVMGEEVIGPEDALPVLFTPLYFAAVATVVKLAESASSVPLAKEEPPIKAIFEIDAKMMNQSFSSSFMDDSSNLELINFSMVCDNRDEKTELYIEDIEESDEKLVSTLDCGAAAENGNEELGSFFAPAELS